MTMDVLARLRQADPHPEQPSYPEATIATMMRAITDTEAETVAGSSAEPRRNVAGWRRHRAMLLSVAAVLVIAVGLAIALNLNVGGHPPTTVATPVSTPPPLPSSDWRTFSDTDYRIQFRYPPAWRTYPYRWAFSFTSSVIYLSTQHIPDPCQRTPTSLSCGPPSMRLTADGVLIIWTETGFPYPEESGGALDRAPGQLTTIAGHAARVYVGSAGRVCEGVGASKSIRAEIARDLRPANNTFDMTACLGPANQSANTRAVLSMLSTVRIGH